MNSKEVYESLRGSRLFRGELRIDNFLESDYENLWEFLITEIIAKDLKGEDYYDWLARKAQSLYRFRKHGRNSYYNHLDDMPDFEDPLTALAPEQLSTRQQLAILKHHIYRRYYSRIN